MSFRFLLIFRLQFARLIARGHIIRKNRYSSYVKEKLAQVVHGF